MSTITATNLHGDTIRKTGGSLGVDIRVKNTSVFESDGGTSVTQNLVQGLAKCWVNFDGTGTPAARDSLNFDSITDNGTGYYTIVFTNPMNNDDYCRSGSVGENANTGANRILGIRLPATTGFNVVTYNTSGGINDNADICCSAHGDLA